VQIAAASRLFRQGIVVKSADGLERLAETDLVVFDKTGTLTLGRPQLLDDDAPLSDDALMAAARLASASKHPYARALVAAAEQRLGRVLAASGVEEVPGRGLKRVLAKGEERLGSAEWWAVDSTGEGSEVWYSRDWMAPGRVRFAHVLRADAAETVAALKRDGYGVALLSGDRTSVVEDIARRTGIDMWRAGLKPADKIAWLDACAGEGRKVLMAGDGLNDAPALAAAHASISPASAADISQRAADFVFQGVKLAPVLEAIATAKRARFMALQNFAIAAGYNAICVPLAMAGMVTPLIAAIVMSTSSILVTANAARLAGRGRP
jgi:Cu2+-exporting ATPase